MQLRPPPFQSVLRVKKQHSQVTLCVLSRINRDLDLVAGTRFGGRGRVWASHPSRL